MSSSLSSPSLAERQQQLLALQRLAWEWRDQQLPGVTLWARLVEVAVQAYPELEPARRSDLILQDLALVILGPASLKYLDWYEGITPDMLEDPMVKAFERDFAAFNLPPASPNSPAWWEVGYAGKVDDAVDPGLDRQFAADFRPDLNDHTDNQIFHTFFYHYMAYVTQAPETIRAASLYHELFDIGGSTEDHTAALIAIATGQQWRQWRDSEQAAEALQDWPASIALAYGKEGGAALLSDMPRLAQPSERLKALEQRITRALQPDLLEQARRGVEYALIGFINGLRKPAP